METRASGQPWRTWRGDGRASANTRLVTQAKSHPSSSPIYLSSHVRARSPSHPTRRKTMSLSRTSPICTNPPWGGSIILRGHDDVSGSCIRLGDHLHAPRLLHIDLSGESEVSRGAGRSLVHAGTKKPSTPLQVEEYACVDSHYAINTSLYKYCKGDKQMKTHLVLTYAVLVEILFFSLS
ncbi:hypothetical protein E2C01_027344 [Portunus trituberculatus]|uniref:Uncharacterized protein n=1 Tax=Portunus trituberculatus TaxID=210409 RepID=A0A5B7ENH7_PORTR|nr:hypothetical protein [Portunus trituberculatus]